MLIWGAIQCELDSFYKEIVGAKFNIREVTKGAFTQARAKLNYEALPTVLFEIKLRGNDG